MKKFGANALLRQRRKINGFIKIQSYIPREVNAPKSLGKEDYYEKFLGHLGFTNLKVEGSFYKCEFPEGWYLEVFEPDCKWCYLKDAKGRKRAAVRYEFMGRVALQGKKVDHINTYINWMGRYRVKVSHTLALEDIKMSSKELKANVKESMISPMIGRVMDAEVDALFETDPIEIISEYPSPLYDQEIKEINSKLYAECEEWLKEKYPDYENIIAYWED